MQKKLFHGRLQVLSRIPNAYDKLATPILSESNSNIKGFLSRAERLGNARYFQGVYLNDIKHAAKVKYVPLLKLDEDTPRELLKTAMKYLFLYEDNHRLLQESPSKSTASNQVSRLVTAFASIHPSLAEHVDYICKALHMLAYEDDDHYSAFTLVITGDGVLGAMYENNVYDDILRISVIIPEYKILKTRAFSLPLFLERQINGGEERYRQNHNRAEAHVKVRSEREAEEVINFLNESLKRVSISKGYEDTDTTSPEGRFKPIALNDISVSNIAEDLFTDGISRLCIRNSSKGITVRRVGADYLSKMQLRQATGGSVTEVYTYNTMLDFFIAPHSHRFGEITDNLHSSNWDINPPIRTESLSVNNLNSGELYAVSNKRTGSEYLAKFWKTKDLVVATRSSGSYLRYPDISMQLVFLVNNPDMIITRANSRDKVAYRAVLDNIEQAERVNRQVEWDARIRSRALKKQERTYRNNSDLETQLFSTSLFNSLVKFIDTNTVAKTLVKLSALGYYKDSTRNVTIKGDLSMTYTPTGKEVELTENGRWSPKGRQVSKYGKLFRKILKEQVPRKKFNDHDIERLVNSIKGEYNVGTFKIVKGEDIRYWYDGGNHYSGNTGTLGSSCMRHSSCLPWLDIYTSNPDQVQLAILTKDGTLKGRALLWDGKWLDRIYGTDITISAFKRHAREEGFWVKESQDSSTCRFLSPDGNSSESAEDIDIQLDHALNDSSSFPYLDTFYYYNFDEGILSGYLQGDYVTELRSTEGGHSMEEDRVWDDFDDRYVHVDDAVYIEDRGIYTHTDNTSYCFYTEESILSEDAVETLGGDTIHENQATYIDYNEGYVSPYDSVETCFQSGQEFALEYSDYEEINCVYVLTEHIDEYLKAIKEEE